MDIIKQYVWALWYTRHGHQTCSYGCYEVSYMDIIKQYVWELWYTRHGHYKMRHGYCELPVIGITRYKTCVYLYRAEQCVFSLDTIVICACVCCQNRSRRRSKGGVYLALLKTGSLGVTSEQQDNIFKEEMEKATDMRKMKKARLVRIGIFQRMSHDPVFRFNLKWNKHLSVFSVLDDLLYLVFHSLPGNSYQAGLLPS